ncbi:hypothetical protein DRE_04429 [Drechslerella stenobrocha 248]|uniref:Eisosome protein 1 n=1 Tax=Drechslerella stenobrocha 248 TaxID=1043628 RepID=W7I1X4_9PEZI|nr:hypothetical protein DRE_04429 [Drechslerella stenobrocha 248]
MFRPKAGDLPPDTNDSAVFTSPPEPFDNDDNLIFSTPRSELNNPMPDRSLLAETSASAEEQNAPVPVPLPAPKTKTPPTAAANACSPKLDLNNPPSRPARGALQTLEASASKAALLAAQTKPLEPPQPVDRLPAAGAAASLASAAVKPSEPWNPGPLPAATAAAVLADYQKTPDVWRPTTPSRSGFKRTKEKGSVDLTPRSLPLSASNALTAAGLACQATSPKKAFVPASTSPATPAYDISKINALAAQNAQARLASALPRSSISQAQADRNSVDILRAASISMSKNTSKSSFTRPEAPNTTTSMPPGSYYSHIPTSPHKVLPPESPANTRLNRRSSVAAASIAASNDLQPNMSSEAVEGRPVKYYPHLEEAARKAAAERLARLQADHDRARKASGLPPSWQQPSTYTRAANPSPAQPASARSTPSMIRKKGQADAGDFARSVKIKADTAKLAHQIDSVDKEKQSRDYLALLSIAEKNVRSRMQELETRVAEHQGRVPKHIQAEWDAKARILSEESEKKRTADQEAKKGKINMGGGLWYDQEDLERIARGNVQPILDEINEKAQKERARVAQLRMDREQADREKRLEAERLAETKAEVKKTKVLEKTAAKNRREAEKAEERQRKVELKESQRQEKERVKADREAQRLAVASEQETATKRDGEEEDDLEEVSRSGSDMTELEPRPMSEAGHARVERERKMHEAAKRERGLFGSIQKRLVRRGSSAKDDKGKAVDYIPDIEREDEEDDGYEISSLSSADKGSARGVPAFASVAASTTSDDYGGSGGLSARGAGLDAGSGARQRYISSSDIGSSVSSNDLYSTTPMYKPLTSATYNPGLAEEDDMPAFMPGQKSSSVSSASVDGMARLEIRG